MVKRGRDQADALLLLLLLHLLNDCLLLSWRVLSRWSWREGGLRVGGSQRHLSNWLLLLIAIFTTLLSVPCVDESSC